MRHVLVLLVACGGGSKPMPGGTADGGAGDAATPDDARTSRDAAPIDATAAEDAMTTTPDAFPGVLDMHIDCHNDCTLIANPASITVQAGTEFEVNWINVGDTECDVAKIDQFNQVPIIIGLEPGTSYHDPVHQWCGRFTGTFEFRIDICTRPSFIPVDCGGP